MLARAKIDRQGIYWPLPPLQRANAGALECTLGFGNAGILLGLAQAYRSKPDPEILDVLAKGLAWLRQRSAKTGFRHGFYGGSMGTWWLFAELESLLPESVEGWRGEARMQLEGLDLDADLPGSLVEGISGTLLGTCLLSDGFLAPKLATALFDRLLAAAKPHPRGVFWDFAPTSHQAPAGLLNGAAGIDLAFARMQEEGGLSATAMLCGSLHYAESLFDADARNWLDQDATGTLRAMRPSDFEAKVMEGHASELIGTAPPEDAIGWATGTLGILQSRAYLQRVFPDGPIGTIVRRDVTAAIDRLARVDRSTLDTLGTSILHGVAGLALGLRACRALLPSDAFSPLEALAERAETLVLESTHELAEEDLSLFTGLAGTLYTRTALAAPEVPNLLAILTHGADAVVPPEPAPRSLAPFFERRLPLCRSTAGAADRLETLPLVSLDAIRQSLNEVDPGADDRTPFTRARAHELSLYDALAEARFQDLFWGELSKQRDFAKHYDQGMDHKLLFGRFRLAETTQLLAFDFDPYARPFTGQPEPTLALRHATSGGVVEIKLTGLQHALLTAFQTDANALEVIAEVVERVDNPNVTQRQLAEFSKNVLRGFLQSGYLVPVKAGTLRDWLGRKRLKSIHQRLFPKPSA